MPSVRFRLPFTRALRATFAALALCAAAGWAHAAIDQNLLAAVMQDNPGQIAVRVSQGVNPNEANAQGNPALHIAIQQESWKAAHALIANAKVDVNRANASGETPLMLAAIKGRIDLVQQLIARGAFVNREGWTPLHYAASSGAPGQTAIIQLLLDNYAFINAQSPNESTPLMMAAGYGSPEAVKLLIQEGAFLDVKNQQGMTARDFAQRGNRVDIVELLAQAQRAGFTQGKW
ncbi:MAG: Protein PhlB [Paracidovorax wautersii]|uniref:Protein PhlB n=1 Tax=Paracidovorax wautersii TaxID=1177982 RepID=A0A7V8JQ52_9BURK|nr:MAG: Protein PhlB [Paracidovorax wautersii]